MMHHYEEAGNYVTDISGPRGIPDGKVDALDVMAFARSWLDEVECTQWD